MASTPDVIFKSASVPSSGPKAVFLRAIHLNLWLYLLLYPLAALIIISYAIYLNPAVLAKCPCQGGGGESWNPASFLDSAFAGDMGENGQEPTDVPDFSDIVETYPRQGMLCTPTSLSGQEVLLKISSEGNISGAEDPWREISLSDLIDDSGWLRSPEEMTNALNAAGIRREDRIAILGDTREAALGTMIIYMNDWGEACLLCASPGEFLSGGTGSSPPDHSNPLLEEGVYPLREGANASTSWGIQATYEDVTSPGIQLLDARTFQHFALGRIKGAVHLDPETLLDGDGLLKGRDELNESFDSFSRDKPVVVYSEKALDAALVWLALEVMGFEARIYNWQDWLAHQPVNSGEDAERNQSRDDHSRFIRLGTS